MLVRLIFAALGVLVVLALLRPRFDFVVRIRDGKATVVKGKVEPGFVVDCERIARDNGVERGEIRGRSRGGDVSLVFSAGIPSRLHQRFRNAYGVHL